MEKIYIAISLFLIGLCLGSFVNAAVWRIKKKKNLSTDRSECIHCHYKLEARDLIPVVSWLWLQGKCRKCKKPISSQYPLVEIAVAFFFLLSFLAWPYELTSVVGALLLVIWLMAGVGLAIHIVYDIRWMVLPDSVTYPLIGMGVVYAVLKVFLMQDVLRYIVVDIGGSLAILSGLYLVLYMYSKGRWIGFGDVKLGIVLALFLTDWQLSLLALFMANMIGCIVIIPALLLGRIQRTSHIPFGPFLIAGFVVAGLFGFDIISWYIALTFAGVPLYL
jgi:prepilin signal peptidase PulO-like enzyme (type II secretory pathway)